MNRRNFFEAAIAATSACALSGSVPDSGPPDYEVVRLVEVKRFSDKPNLWHVQLTFSNESTMQFTTKYRPIPKLWMGLIGKPRQSYIIVTG